MICSLSLGFIFYDFVDALKMISGHIPGCIACVGDIAVDCWGMYLAYSFVCVSQDVLLMFVERESDRRE